MFYDKNLKNDVTRDLKGIDLTNATKGLLGLSDSNTVKIGSFVFDFIGNIRVTMKNTITQNLTESNKILVDNISINPTVISFDGYIGECFIDRANTEDSTVTATTKVASLILGLLPQNKATKVLKNVQMGVDYLYGIGKNILKTLKNHSYQTEGFNLLERMRKSQGIYTVMLPYKTYNNMAFTNLIIEQPRETKDYSRCSITMQEIPTFKTKTTKFTEQNPTENSIVRYAGDVTTSVTNIKGKVDTLRTGAQQIMSIC